MTQNEVTDLIRQNAAKAGLTPAEYARRINEMEPKPTIKPGQVWRDKDINRAESIEAVAAAMEGAAPNDDAELMDWLASPTGHDRLPDWLWDDAAKLCPIDFDEAENTGKWIRAAIRAAIAAEREVKL